MREILSFIPGFRSKKIWKVVIASIYYFIALLMIFESRGLFLSSIALPFMIFAIAGIIKKKGKVHIVTAILAFIVFCVGSVISPQKVDNTKVDNPVEATKQEENNDSKKEEQKTVDNTTTSDSASTQTKNNNPSTTEESNTTSSNSTNTEEQTSNVTKPVDDNNSTNNQVVQNNSEPVNTQPVQPTQTQIEPSAPVSQTAETQDNGTVYFVPNGKSYHYSSGCSTLSRSKNILSGTLQEAINSGHADPCDKCTH